MIVLAAVLFVGIFAYLFQRSRPKEAIYEEYVAAKKDIVRTTVVTGKIQPRDEVNIKPQISGIITEMYKEAGQTVKKDEIIAKVKVIPDMSQLSAAQSRVRLAEVNLKQAKVNFDREKVLYDKSLVSSEEYEKVQQLYSQAQEELAGAKEALEIIRDGVSSSNASGSSTLIRSTISGLILDIPVKVGNSVTQSNTFNDGTTIATVADMDDLIFDGNIDETEVGRLSVGMPVRITLGAIQNVSFDAVLEYIAPKATVNNGANQFEIKASVKVPAGVTIRSGYSANAEIVLDKAEGVISLPEAAIQFEGDTTYVMIKSATGYTRKDVVTGLSDGINIHVVEGINEGDSVRGSEVIIKKD